MSKYIRPVEINGVDCVNGRAFSKKSEYNVRFPNNVLALGLKPLVKTEKFNSSWREGSRVAFNRHTYFEITDDLGRPIRFRSIELEIEVA